MLRIEGLGHNSAATDESRYYRSPKRIDPTTTYVFPRTLGGGVILGGSRQDNDWSAEWDSELEAQILERACKLAPELGRPQDLQIIARNVGLRREYPLDVSGVYKESSDLSRVNGCANRRQRVGRAVRGLRSRRKRNGTCRLCMRMGIRAQGIRRAGGRRRG